MPVGFDPKILTALRLCIGLALFLSAPSPLLAHPDPQPTVPSLRALRVDAPLDVDGVLSEPFWTEAAVATGFIDVRTQRPAEQQTTVRIAYTRAHLYIAVECFDDRIAGIHATERREDRSFVGDDWVEIHIDPPHTHRTKYAFFANPLGTRADANEGPSGMFNYGWSAEWDLAASIQADRWVFEMRIPLTIMNYERRDDQSWGFNVTRQLRRTDVLSFWSFSATDMYKPRNFGHIEGLDLADSIFDRNWEVTPYLSARTDFNGDVDTFVHAGLDVSFRLTPAITTALTLNPDFGQVEADAATIELRDTERFLPEKRPFFREGDELIRMPYRMYYSRRFSEIDAGLNLSGLYHGLGFSFLNVQGDVARDDGYHGNSSVLRVLQNIGQRSSLGYYASGSALEGSATGAGSLDGYFFLTDDWRVSFQAAATSERLEDENGDKFKDREDYLGFGSLIYERYPWSFALGYRAITEGFDPLLGYVPRRDIFGPSLLGQIYLKSDGAYYKEFRLTYDGAYYEDSDSAVSLRDHAISSYALLPSDIGLRLGQSIHYHAPHDNRRTSAGLSVFTSDFWKSASLGWGGGVFEEVDYNEFILAKPIKPWGRLPIQWEFVVRLEDHPDGSEETVWLNRVIFDLYLAKDMWIKSSFQHQDDHVRNISIIYGWKFWREAWWYLVFNNVNDSTDSGNSIFTKVTYTF
jgi:hypothetical protein